jgi:hypothetical protein
MHIEAVVLRAGIEPAYTVGAKAGFAARRVGEGPRAPSPANC